jgi:selenocysteine lyase/cysteine desulfurase
MPIAIVMLTPHRDSVTNVTKRACNVTGAGQFTTSQLTAAFKELSTTGLGNPHSNNPSSARATQEVAAARALVRAHFNASPEEYHVIFTK